MEMGRKVFKVDFQPDWCQANHCLVSKSKSIAESLTEEEFLYGT
jgi:hypothetical protein